MGPGADWELSFMALYWTAFANQVLPVGADVVTDMLPVLAVIFAFPLAGALIALVKRVIR